MQKMRLLVMLCGLLLCVTDIWSGDIVSLIPELILYRVPTLAHDAVCALALVSKRHNAVAHDRDMIEARKRALQPTVEQTLQSTLPDLQFIAWHTLGSSCTFMQCKNNEEKLGLAVFIWCRTQLHEDNETITQYMHSVEEDIDGGPVLCPNKNNKWYRERVKRKELYYEFGKRNVRPCVKLSVPLFNQWGEVCMYYCDRSSDTIKQYSMDTKGIVTKRTCLFSYKGTQYPLGLLLNTGLVLPFVQSVHERQTDTQIVFCADAVRMDDRPLSSYWQGIIEARISKGE